MNEVIDLDSLRAKEARFGRQVGNRGYQILVIVGSTFAAGAVFAYFASGRQLAVLLLSPMLLCYVPAIWLKQHILALPPSGTSFTDRLSSDVLSRLNPKQPLTPRSVWEALAHHWQSYFFLNHLFLPIEMITPQITDDPSQLGLVFKTAAQLADTSGSRTIDVGFVVGALLLTSPNISYQLTQDKADPADISAIANWFGRALAEQNRAKQNFGGIGRDWAFGFTPLLDRYGYNVSLSIQKHGAHFGWLTTSDGVLAIEAAFKNHTNAIALIGPDGIGKTNSVYALAQRLIEANTDQVLAYHQVLALNATDIVSAARRPGDLENIMLSLANEASHAGHIILFFDNAELFFGDGPGSFDASQILLSVLGSRNIRMILAFTPNDYQRLKTRNSSLASRITPVVLQELSEAGVMRVLEDSAIGLEGRHKVIITYQALRESYRLSGRYEHDEAYPGKAIKLLEQSIPYANGNVVLPESVQQAIEQTRGVKVSTAAPAEATALLNLEDEIHKRMINQTHAVSVVASALRRARAGVTNPNRPIGSFLFLGPTGVGKTELAKAIAATYFRSVSSMIRLDMSEYQQPDDVQRLLSTGEQDTSSLLMSVRQQPFSVVLLDEIEKAHPNILNLLLQLLDEGQLTDLSGRVASFKDCVIIATSNAGAQTIRERIGRGESLESFANELTDELIKGGQFKPELLNRFDETVLFRPLNPAELAQVVRLMLNDVNKTLTNQNISVELTDAALSQIVAKGNDPRLGARPLRRELQRTVENSLAKKILRNEARPGDKVILDVADLESS